MTKRRTSGTGWVGRWRKRNSKTGKLEQVGWMAMVDLGIVDGHRKRLTKYGKRERDVADWLNDTLRDHQRGVLPKSGAMTVEQWLTKWLRGIESSVRARTLEHYEGIVRLHLIPAIGRRPLAKLAPSDVEAMTAMMIRNGSSARSAHHRRAVLRNALKAAERDGYVSRNAAALARPPRVTKTEMATLSPDQVKAFLIAL